MTAYGLVHDSPGVIFERVSFVAVRAACPRCGWRAPRNHAAGTYGWRKWLAADLARHTCTADQEKP